MQVDSMAKLSMYRSYSALTTYRDGTMCGRDIEPAFQGNAEYFMLLDGTFLDPRALPFFLEPPGFMVTHEVDTPNTPRGTIRDIFVMYPQPPFKPRTDSVVCYMRRKILEDPSYQCYIEFYLLATASSDTGIGYLVCEQSPFGRTDGRSWPLGRPLLVPLTESTHADLAFFARALSRTQAAASESVPCTITPVPAREAKQATVLSEAASQSVAVSPPRAQNVHPLRGDSPYRLMIDYVCPLIMRPGGPRAVKRVNERLLGVTGDPSIAILGIHYTRAGRPTIIADFATNAEILAPFAQPIFDELFGLAVPVKGYPDAPAIKVKLDHVPTKDGSGNLLTVESILDNLAISNARYRKDALMTSKVSWISSDVSRKSQSTLVFCFLHQRDADQFFCQRSFLVFGERCLTKLFQSVPPPKR